MVKYKQWREHYHSTCLSVSEICIIVLCQLQMIKFSISEHFPKACYMYILYIILCTDVEFWIESDSEIDEDIDIESANIPPPDVSLIKNSEEEAEQNLFVKWIVTLLSIFQTRFFLTNNTLDWFLKFLGVLLRYLGKYSTKISEIAMKLPQSLYKHNRLLTDVAINNSFEKQAVCMTCDSLYSFEKCIEKVGTRLVINHCTFKPFQKTCNQPLMKAVVSSSGHERFYPYKVYCFVNLISSLQALVLHTGFIEQCESTRKCFSSTGYSDVYDGSIWKEFITVDQLSFLSECNNYGLLLNIDWLQPFKHLTYSVGVIYLVILNLPHSIRYNRENIILFGVIPGPSEPSLTVNSYLSPLVADLLKLWRGIQFKVPGKEETAIFRCALLGVACDLPAARKACGFLSFSANLGCSRCFQTFSSGFGKNDYSNFDREKWVLCSNDRHRLDVKKTLKCANKSQRAKLESKLGCRYSILLELPYFCPMEMLLIDPMHNLFLGTAKHFARDLWIAGSIFGMKELAKIEERLANTLVPTGLGRIPVSINNGVFLTAEQ